MDRSKWENKKSAGFFYENFENYGDNWLINFENFGENSKKNFEETEIYTKDYFKEGAMKYIPAYIAYFL